MHALVETYHDTNRSPIVIIGTGPVGIRMADELLKIDSSANIVMYGNEPWEPYNRVGLTSFLAGDISFDDIKNPVKAKSIRNLIQHHNCEIVSVDRLKKTVTDASGKKQSYSHLILAIGASPHIPNISGVKLPNVYTLRDLKDVDQLFARRMRSRRTVVIGGGLLGLEAARAMQKHNTEVVIIEHADRLMSRQLDEMLSDQLRESILGFGIKVRLRTGVRKIKGDISVTGVELSNGKSLDCDTVILATGIVPNKKLAQNSGLLARRGIRVNDQLQTSDENIFAVGECCEHNGEVFGLVAPGFEQAAIAAQVINGKTAEYKGSVNVSKLKVFGLDVYSVGEAGDDADNISNQIIVHGGNERDEGCHRLVVRHRRLVGAMGVGVWPEFERIKEAVNKKRRVWPWQLKHFEKTGTIWSETDEMQISSWPANAVVCNCKTINRGELSACIANGASSVECIQSQTGASTVCGSCRPLINGLLGESVKLSPQIAYKALATLSAVVSALIAIFIFSPPIPYVDSVQSIQFDRVWTDFFYRQVSGYTLAGITLAGVLMLSIRKRFNLARMGGLPYWRITHVSMSLAALSLLVLHTGLNTGSNLNFLLFLFFVLVSLLGIISSLVNAYEHLLSPYKAKQWRNFSNRAHIYLSWPLPVFLAYHIAAAYYF